MKTVTINDERGFAMLEREYEFERDRDKEESVVVDLWRECERENKEDLG